MLKIRLRRMGSRHRPFYRVVVSDSRRVPAAAALEEVGYYDPRKKPVTLNIDIDRVEHWMSHGAQPSSTVRKLVAQARLAPVEAPAAEPEVEAAAVKESDKSDKSDLSDESDKSAAEAEAAAAVESAESAESAEPDAEAQTAEPDDSTEDAAAETKAETD